MADVNKEIALEVSLKDSTGAGTQSAKQRLREMQKELIAMAQAGQQGTDAFKRLEQQAGALKDEIGDVNQRIKNLASDTKRIDAFVGAVQGIAAGFQIAQGAAALFGDENEDLQKAMLKVQGAIALANGVQQVANLLQKESSVMMGLNTLATKAYATVVGDATEKTRLFRLALAGLGLAGILVVLGLIAEAMGFFNKVTEDATSSQKDLKRSLEDTAGTLEYYERKLKANGATEADLAKIRRKAFEAEKAELERKLQEDVARFGVKNDKYQNSLRQEIELLGIKIKEESKIINQAASTLSAAEKSRRDKAIADRKAEQERTKAIEIEGYYERLELQKQFAAEYEATIIAGMQKEAAARIKGAAIINAQDKASKAGQAQREADLAALREKYVGQSFAVIGDIIQASAGKSEEAQRRAFNVAKAASIAQAIVSTYLAVNSALAIKPTETVFPGQRFVEAGLALAAGLANVAKIKATQFQGGGGSAPGGGVMGGTAGASMTPPPIFTNPQTTNLGTGDLSSGQGQQNQPMRAYVVERDIQQTTSRVRRLSEFATLG
jgi:hypothetical protein